MVHIEQIEKVQHFIQAHSVSLNIFQTGGILCNQRADDGKDCKQNEERNGEFEGTEKIIDYGKKPILPRFGYFLRFLHAPYD
jgi:hypothetical protein